MPESPRRRPTSLAQPTNMYDQLARNALVFARTLHRLGLPAQPDRAVLFLRALAKLGWRSRADAKAAGRCIFVRNGDQRQRYDEAFDAFWSTALLPALPSEARAEEPGDEEGSAAARSRGRSGPADKRTSSVDARADASAAPPPPAASTAATLIKGGDRSHTYSFSEALSPKEFAELDDEEARIARRLAQAQQLDFGVRRSRRMVRGAQGGSFDIRRALRAGLRHHGDVLVLPSKMPDSKRRDIVLLCDISGSMDRHTRLLLQFMHGMRHALGKVEAFVFGTRLTRITREIRHRDINAALNEIAARVPDWGGGTRIGECLHEFNQRWARRVLAHGAIVIIISDGWDRGDIGLLAREMQRLQRRSYRLIWLNPLLGSKNYRPQTVGMQAALPYIDDFLPAHDLRSLLQLIEVLRPIAARRPVRRQMVAPAAALGSG